MTFSKLLFLKENKKYWQGFFNKKVFFNNKINSLYKAMNKNKGTPLPGMITLNDNIGCNPYSRKTNQCMGKKQRNHQAMILSTSE